MYRKQQLEMRYVSPRLLHIRGGKRAVDQRGTSVGLRASCRSLHESLTVSKEIARGAPVRGSEGQTDRMNPTSYHPVRGRASQLLVPGAPVESATP